jgi:DNA processing protein
MSWGPNLLVKQGAKLVQEWTDVTNELPAALRRDLVNRAQQRVLAEGGDQPGSPPGEGPEEPMKQLARKLLNHLQIDVPQQLEGLVETFESVSSSELIGALFELEMTGLVRQLPGKSFVKVW